MKCIENAAAGERYNCNTTEHPELLTPCSSAIFHVLTSQDEAKVSFPNHVPTRLNPCKSRDDKLALPDTKLLY